MGSAACSAKFSAVARYFKVGVSALRAWPYTVPERLDGGFHKSEIPTTCPGGSKYVNTAEWTLQQFRECVTGMKHMDTHSRPGQHLFRRLDAALKSMGLTVLRTAIQIAPGECRLRTLQSAQRAESICTMIPLNEGHVRQTLKGWLAHYNHGRPHSSLGPGIPNRSVPT